MLPILRSRLLLTSRVGQKHRRTIGITKHISHRPPLPLQPLALASQPFLQIDPVATDASLPAVLAFNQTTLETIHSIGLPWWATIIATTVAFRSSLTFPIAIYQQRQVGRRIELAPMVQSWAETLKMVVAKQAKRDGWDYKRYELEFRKRYREKVKMLYAHHGCSRWKSFVLPLVQIPLFMSMAITLRSMSGFPIPFWDGGAPMASFVDGGCQWFVDLTATDTSMIFPVLIGAGSLLNCELNVWFTKDKIPEFQQTFINITRCLSLATVPIAAYAPAAICLFWVTSSWYSVAQNVAFRIPAVRRRLALPMLNAPPK